MGSWGHGGGEGQAGSRPASSRGQDAHSPSRASWRDCTIVCDFSACAPFTGCLACAMPLLKPAGSP